MDSIESAYAFPAQRAYRESSCDPFHYDTVAQQINQNDYTETHDSSNLHGLEPSSGINHEPDSGASSSNDAVVFEQQPVEYVQALHDYSSSTSGSNVCLSFIAGQLIKVLNKDASGWWDGEAAGKRGWFPSNYVVSLNIYSAATVITILIAMKSFVGRKASDSTTFTEPGPSPIHNIDAAASASMRRAATTPTSTFIETNVPEAESPAFDATRLPAANDGITASILHAMSLMRKAVDASRCSHFGPATTCLIASVRSVLSATDCLTRDSVILRTHLILARERKQILSILAGLVNQARSAAMPNLIHSDRAKAMDTMLAMADNVLKNVEHFLQTAAKCGVTVPTAIDEDGEKFQSQQLLRLEEISTPNLDVCLQFIPTSENHDIEIPSFPAAASSTSKALHKARSLSDMKVSKRKMSEASAGTGNGHGGGAVTNHSRFGLRSGSLSSKTPSPPQVPKPPPSIAMIRRPSIPAVYTPSLMSPAWQSNDSVSSRRSSASISSSGGPITPASQSSPQQSVEVYRTLSLIHDGLLSNIAAFIGHVHTHSRSSHSSSYAHLIDMTRETIDRVREELLIIDVVTKHPAVQPFASSVKFLERHREHLYIATTALVTAARNATTPTSLDLANTILVREQEDQEKDELIKAATGVLRASADIVNATKPILLKKGLDGVVFVIDFLQITRPTLSRRGSASSEIMPDEDDDVTLQASTSGNASEGSGLSVVNKTGKNDNRTFSTLEQKDSCLIHTPDQDDLDRRLHRLPSAQTDSTGEAEKRSSGQPAPDKVTAWQIQQGKELSHRPSLDLQISPARTSVHLSRPAIISADEVSERPQSSLSMRRGMPVPANLQISQRPALHSRTPSFGSMSAASTVTSLPEKVSVSNPEARPAVPVAQPFSPATSSGSSSYKAGGEPMSRNESSRGSAASTATSSYQSAFSEANTAETSPHSSVVFPSPAEEKLEWQITTDLSNRRPIRPDFLRARSGSTPDRVTALRISEGNPYHQLPSPLSSRSAAIVTSGGESLASKSWFLERDYSPKECEFGNDGNVRGASLRCLIERMTLHDQTIDPDFSIAFFLTFRMFTTPSELVEALIMRYNLDPPVLSALTESDRQIWHDKKLVPVRLRIYNFFKIWLESHWRSESDSSILDRLLSFTKETMALTMAAPAQRLVDLLQKRNLFSGSGGPPQARGLVRMVSAEKLKAGRPIFDGQALGSATFPSPYASLPPSPIVSKSLFSALRTAPFAPSSILDFDPLELGRQFTIMESKLFCVIQPEELIGLQSVKKSTIRNSTIRMMSSLSTRITGWIAEIILSEQDAKKRTALIKYFIKLGDRCYSLQNFNTLMAILAALNSSTISRLKRTWEGLSNKYKAMLENLRKATEHTRNYAEYRANIRGAVAPCLPFLGLYLTDITFCYDGNPAVRTSPLDSSLRLINFDRYQKITKYVGDLQRFQRPYNLVEVPEIQNFLQAALANVENGGDAQALYRRSLMVEPRQNANEQTAYQNTTGKDLFNWRG